MATKKQNANESPVEAAERILAELQARHDKTVKARETDDRELGSVSYAAFAAGDRDATEKLECVKGRIRDRDLELQAIRSAIAQAQNNLREAQADEAAEVERLAATELLGLCKVLREAGQQADDALVVLGEAAETLGDTITAINRLGVANPSSLQLSSLGERSIRTALRTQPWARAFEDVPPADRRNFASFVNAWVQSLEQSVNHKLNQLNKGSGTDVAA